MFTLCIGHKIILCIVNIVHVANTCNLEDKKHKACGETIFIHTLLKYYNDTLLVICKRHKHHNAHATCLHKRCTSHVKHVYVTSMTRSTDSLSIHYFIMSKKHA